MADDWGAIVDAQESGLTKKEEDLNIAGASNGSNQSNNSASASTGSAATGSASTGLGEAQAAQPAKTSQETTGALGTSETTDEKTVTKEEESLLKKLIHTKLMSTIAEVPVFQNDLNNQFHSVKICKAINFEWMTLQWKQGLLKGVREMGFDTPSKIQQIHLLLADPPTNMIAQSQSGTRKTAAFVFIMLSQVDPFLPHTQCLCLAPTYELALQIGRVAEKMAEHMIFVKIGYAVKGKRIPKGEKCPHHILIGTPGTVLDWCVKCKSVDPKKLKVFVLDEADVIIATQGCQDQSMRVRKLLAKSCKILLFSATYEEEVMKFAQAVIPNSPRVIKLWREEEILDNIKQYYIECRNKEDKYQAFANIYGSISIGQAVIFCATWNTAHWLSEKMTKDGHAVALLSGDLEIEQRESIMNRFRDGKEKVLIITNVSAEGIDVEMVTVVVNFDLPILQDTKQADCETYLHRIGQTGRFEKAGIAINMVDSKKSFSILRAIEKHFGRKIEKLDAEDMDAIEKIST